MKIRELAAAAAVMLVLTGAGAVQAEGQPAEQKPILVMGIKPQPTPEETEAMKWADVFTNDTARYLLNMKSFQTQKDSDEVTLLARAVYKDPALLKKLNGLYSSRLKEDDQVGYSDMTITFRLKNDQYAVSEMKVYSRKGELLQDIKKNPIFSPVPANTFAETMYRAARQYKEIYPEGESQDHS